MAVDRYLVSIRVAPAAGLQFHPSALLLLDCSERAQRIEFQAQNISCDGLSPTSRPSNFFAFDFKGKFALPKVAKPPVTSPAMVFFESSNTPGTLDLSS
jgi:hypothetical protein